MQSLNKLKTSNTTVEPDSKYHENMSDLNGNSNYSNNNNDENNDTYYENGEDEINNELRPILTDLISTIRSKLEMIEADVDQVTTLDALNGRKHYLNILQEITRILAAFPRSDGYEAKELPESFSGKPRLIAFRNNMNFMLWENNSKLHLILDYVLCTDTVNKLPLVLNVVHPIKTALDVVGDLSPTIRKTPSPQIGGVGDTGPIVAHLNEFAEKRWAERGRQVVRPARYSATTFAGSSRKFMEKMRLQVDYTLESLSNGNLDESFYNSFDSSSPLIRFTRSPSVSSIPIPSKVKVPARREASNVLLKTFNLNSFSPQFPFTPDYSRPQAGWNSPRIQPKPISFVPTTAPRPAAKSSNPPPDALRRSNSFHSSSSNNDLAHQQAGDSPPTSPKLTHSQSPPLVRSTSLGKDFSPVKPEDTQNSDYPTSPPSPPPSPPIDLANTTSRAGRPTLQSLKLERSSSSVSSNSSSSPTSSFRASFEFPVPGTEDGEREDPFDCKSVQHLPSFNVDGRNGPPSPHATSTSLPSRFSYALLSPVLPPAPFPAYPTIKSKQRASLAASNDSAFRKLDMSAQDGATTDPVAPVIPRERPKPESEGTESDRLLRRSSSDSIRVPSSVRVRYPAASVPASPEGDRTPSPGSKLKFEMDTFSDSRAQTTTTTSTSTTQAPPSPTTARREEMGIKPREPPSPMAVSSNALVPANGRNRFMQQHRKRNMSISFALHALSRNLLVPSPASVSTPSMGKVEEAIMSRAASFKSDWLCPVLASPGYRIDMGSTNVVELPTCMNIMDLDLDISYYRNEFLGGEHHNFLGTLRSMNAMPGKPVGVSMKFVKPSETNAKFGEIIALVRTIERDERVTIAFQPNLLASTTPSRKRLVKLIQKNVPRLKDAHLEEIKEMSLHADFDKFEAQLRVTRYKFGVLYCADGQTEENDIYSNVATSADFSEFLRVLGDSVELKGWKQFRGGLDVKNNTTGSHSVYTKWSDYEIMFHVGPLLPYDEADEQRVERKRHIGNDIVVLIFKDGPSQINPTIFKSHFNHVFMIVQKDHAKSDILPHYRVTFVCKDEVQVFGPMYPHSYSFPNTSKFREFVITKLMNAERSAMHSPVFFSKTKRTRQELLQGYLTAYAGKKP